MVVYLWGHLLILTPHHHHHIHIHHHHIHIFIFIYSYSSMSSKWIYTSYLSMGALPSCPGNCLLFVATPLGHVDYHGYGRLVAKALFTRSMKCLKKKPRMETFFKPWYFLQKRQQVWQNVDLKYDWLEYMDIYVELHRCKLLIFHGSYGF